MAADTDEQMAHCFGGYQRDYSRAWNSSEGCFMETYASSASGAGPGCLQVGSWDTDGFTLYVSTAFSQDLTINYMVFGNTDIILNVTVQEKTVSTALSQSITGIGFQPNWAMNMHAGTLNSIGAGFGMCYGTDSTGGQFGYSANNLQTDTNGVGEAWWANGYGLEWWIAVSGGWGRTAQWALASWDSDGFSLTSTGNNAGNAEVSFLCVEFSTSYLPQTGIITIDSDLSEQTETHGGIHWDPAGGLFLSHVRHSASYPYSHCYSVGMAHDTGNQQQVYHHMQGESGWLHVNITSTDRINRPYSIYSTAWTEGTYLRSWDSDGFTYQWDTDDSAFAGDTFWNATFDIVYCIWPNGNPVSSVSGELTFSGIGPDGELGRNIFLGGMAGAMSWAGDIYETIKKVVKGDLEFSRSFIREVELIIATIYGYFSNVKGNIEMWVGSTDTASTNPDPIDIELEVK